MKRLRDAEPSLPGRWSRRKFLSAAGKAGVILAGAGSVPFSLGRGRGGFVWARQSGVEADKSKLIVRSAKPEDIETPLGLLDSWITPNDHFYVRSHLYTPEIDLSDWSLVVQGLVERPATLTLDDLSRFPRVSSVVTVECAGNGRAWHDPPVAGVQWEKGAIGTARWTGIRLRDLLMRVGLRRSAKHVAFDGADEPIGTVPDFVRSIPIKKALHPATMLAFEMNGEPIPIQHGYPLRVITPGWEGAASVKWLTRIEVLDREADGHFMKNAYRIPTRLLAPGEAVDPKDMAVIESLNVKSLITAPLENATFNRGVVQIRGLAWAGEATVVGVEVSTDHGRTWQPAAFSRNYARYAWREWAYTWRPRTSGSYVILCRARDSWGRVQPIAPMWNPAGYLWNVIDRVRVTIA